MIRTPPQHQTDPDKMPGQVVRGDYTPTELRAMATVGVNFLSGAKTGRMVSSQPARQELSKAYKPAHGGYPGEVKAR